MTLDITLDMRPAPTPAPFELGGILLHRLYGSGCRGAAVGYGPGIEPTRHHSVRLALLVTVVTVGVAAAACSNDDGEAVIDVGDTVVGACLDFGDTVGEEVTSLPVVDCADEHTHQVYAVEFLGGDTYPGFDALEAEAQALCLNPFEEFVGVSAFDSELFYSWLVPTLNSWERDDDREVICVVGENDGAPLTGSLEGAAR